MLALVLAWASTHIASVGACVALLARARGHGPHYAVMRWFVGTVARTALRVARVRVEVRDSAAAEAVLEAKEQPIVALSIHSGEGDSLLVLDMLLRRYRPQPRIVMHQALSLDPLIDMLGNRLPNRFVDPRGGDIEVEIAAMSRDLGAHDAVLIFPEGGNFTPERRLTGIQRLMRRGHHAQAQQAQSMEHLSAPRPGGALAALESAPGRRRRLHGPLRLSRRVRPGVARAARSEADLGADVARAGRGDPGRHRSPHRVAVRLVEDARRVGRRPAGSGQLDRDASRRRAAAVGLEGDGQRERGDDGSEELERRLQPERRRPARRRRSRAPRSPIGDDVEGRHDLGAVLRRDRDRERAQAAEERDAEAGAADDRAEPVQRGRLGAGGDHDRDHAGRQRERARRRRPPTARCARTASWATAAGAGEGEDGERGDQVVVGVQQGRAQQRAERDEQPADRPDRDHGQRGQQERAPDRRRGRSGAAGSAGRGRWRVTGSGIRSAPEKAIAKRTNSTTYGSTRGAGASSTSSAETSDAQAHPAGADDAVGQPDRGRVAGGCRSSSAALAAPSARPVARPWMPRATNSHATESASMNRTLVAISVAERAQQHGPAADLVRQPAGEQQRGEDAEGVRRVDQRQHERREAPELAVGAVERGRSAGREQSETDHRRDMRVGDTGRQRAAIGPGFDWRTQHAHET